MPYPDHPSAAELETAVAAASEAGRAIRDLSERAAAATYTKADGSPVTDADLAADRAIRAILAARFPADPVLTEEGADDPARLASSRCWIVDPLDGTAEFVAGSGNFDVLVALVVDGRPVAAAACHPPTGLVCAAALGGGAWTTTPDHPRPRPLRFPPLPPASAPRLATSTWFGAPANAAILARVAARVGAGPPEPTRVGFSPRQFFDPAHRRDALIGLRAGDDPHQAMGWEWDFAVADLIVREAGGLVTDLDGRPHRYNKPDTHNLGGLLAAVDPALHARLLAALVPERPGGGGAANAPPDPT
jgi:3'-phosphoadenosine 5'-phosphosulfate (PAPS) 3'-phosphatase